jgi:hypothetical protein
MAYKNQTSVSSTDDREVFSSYIFGNAYSIREVLSVDHGIIGCPDDAVLVMPWHVISGSHQSGTRGMYHFLHHVEVKSGEKTEGEKEDVFCLEETVLRAMGTFMQLQSCFFSQCKWSAEFYFKTRRRKFCCQGNTFKVFF